MKNLRLWAVTLLLVSFIFLPLGTASDVPFADVPFDVTDIPEPAPPPPAVRDFFQLDPYYQQWVNVRGFPVLASEEVSPYAVKEVAWIIGHMIGHRPDVLREMAERTVRFSIVPHNKHTSDMPESNTGRLSFFWDVRHRAVHCTGCPIASTTEEDLISKPSAPIHGFGHLLQDWGLNGVDPTFNNRVITLFDMAKAEGLYQGRYAGSTVSEYWAEGVASWFHDTNPNQHVALTRSALEKYDSRLAKLLTEVFGDGDWRYTRPATRTHHPHLQGFNPQEAPIYQRPTRLLELEAQLKDPTSDGGGKWVNLKLYDPSALSHLKKLTIGRNRTDFIFGNLTGTDLTLYFFDHDGKKTLRYYSTTDDFTAIDTQVGAIWLIQDHTGKGIAVFRAEEEVGRVLVTPTPLLITPGLSKVSGDNQGGVPGAILANPFVIEVRDESLSMLEGISVTFTVTAGDGTLSVSHTTTDENGRAESTLTLGPNLGTNAVSVSAAGIEHPVTFNAVAEAGVHIPNTNLRTAIETARGKAEGDSITPSEIATLTRLDAQNANISDLTGLEFATNLTSLNLGHVYVRGRPINSNSISNILPLAGLTYLTELRLGFNLIADISALAGLTNLTWLDLTGNSVSNIAPVASLTKLTQLDLDGNAISNISPVAGLTNLTFLDIWGTSISDISPVAGLTHLTSLGLGHNNISDISPVAGMTNLTGLYLPSNHITDISSLSGLTNLKTLWLNQNSISDLSPLVANTGLGSGDTVDVRQNRLSDQSLYTHIPALQSRGVTVEFDNRTPTSPLKITGDDQQGTPGTALERPFVIEVRDAGGSAFEGVPVTFTVTAGGGTLSVTSTKTDANGRAESTLTLGPAPGTNTITVSATGIQEGQTFNAEGTGVSKTLEIVSGDDQEGPPGAALDKAFVVEVRDQSDSPLSGVEVNFSVGSGGGTLSATSVTTDSNGRAESTLTLGPNAGTNTVSVSVTGIQEQKTFTSEGIRIPLAFWIISGDKQQGLLGEALAKPFVVEVRDQSGEPLPGVQVTFSVSIGGGTLSVTSATTDGKGRAESILTLGPNAGTNTVTVSVAGIEEGQTFNAEGLRTPTTLEIVSGNDQEGLPGAALEKPFVVEVRDQADKPLEDVQVTFSVKSGGGTLSATNVTTDAVGRAESTLTLGPNPGTNTVTASVAGIQETRTFTAESIRIPKRMEIISGGDQEGLPGAALENPFVVEVRDQTDGPLPDVRVLFTIGSGGGTLSATNVTTDANGRAENTLTLGPNPGTNTVTVSVTGIQEQKTFTAEGIRIPLAFWIISGDKQQGLLGEALAKPFVVEVRDQSGEPLPGVQVTFSVSIGGGTLSVTSATTDGKGRAESILTLGPNPGTNTVSVSVTGIQEAQSVTAIAEPPPIPQDVNRDDVVNILDLVLVASVLGTEGLDLAADVNGDGVVNILDLVLVAGAFGDAAAAPSAQAPQTLTAADVQTWLTDARSLAGKDAMIKTGIVVLEQLLAALTPPETALLLNFPNPFNPETWIPYQLAEDTNVTLTIYDTTGTLVRRLDLGHQLAGYYTNRGKAAYWDGRNEGGESVASGIYFYQLATPSYRHLRRMVILK